MFFFIGGIQPKTIDLGQQPVLCPSCGLLHARHKRVDYYIAVFFIPLIRIKKGDPVLMCERCGYQSMSHETGANNITFGHKADSCRYCGGALGGNYRYCPFCGREI